MTPAQFGELLLAVRTIADRIERLTECLQCIQEELSDHEVHLRLADEKKSDESQPVAWAPAKHRDI